jgi:hypothetical protein
MKKKIYIILGAKSELLKVFSTEEEAEEYMSLMHLNKRECHLFIQELEFKKEPIPSTENWW